MKVIQPRRVKGSWFVVLFLLSGLLVSSSPCFAAGDSLGKEIREKAKKMKLDKTKVVHGKKNGKRVKFTGAKLEHVKSMKDLEQGEVVGVLDNELSGDETNLPPGKHNVFLKKVNGEWKAYAESGGKVVAEAARVTMEKKDKKEAKPQFKPDGWCYCWYLCCGWVYICVCW
ncbi:MAG: hypothetical protein GTO45_07550 [Candidatus Aminicenantes bacterium]|nr:hypothetical protein [Candidatus Aminicenantes bacterium]NIM78690.1 hypothetical protein [Candidatus Aminicenantes bacterium]NIN17938.1 hypothetical protein [Candidatus Aminicenantes bacterium]NIN41841.1 hypothetical protein [Candidatus Aminicenantes bacterium]NIN84593.1 hypothetical protein [Candidatus Aminicenantes bacterium]